MRLPLGTCFVTAAGPCGARTPHPQPRGGSARTLVRAPRFGLAPVRSPLLGGSLFDFLSSGYLDVSVPPVASDMVGSRPSPAGFPHSGTPGSKPVCGSPGTIAACRALRRLPAPRHPPCALHTFGTLGPSGFRSCLCSLEKSLPLRAMRLSGCPAHDSCEPRGPDAAGMRGSSFPLGRSGFAFSVSP